MGQTANITSFEAVEAFRAQLIVYLTKVRPLLEEISSEIIRLHQWLDSDQRRHWENQFRLRSRKLEEARAELFSARLSKLQEASALHYMAVQRAERAVRETESKLSMVRKWSRDLESRASPLIKQTEQYQTFLATEMPRALAHLESVIQTLESYADTKPERAR
jgi:hypothetical protein